MVAALMEFVITPIVVAGLLLGTLNLALAALVFLAGPDRNVNRLLASLLLLNGINITSGAGLMYLIDDYASAFGFQMVAYVCLAGSLTAYPIFMGTALRTPLVAPFRWWPARLVFIGVTVAAIYLILSNPILFSTGLFRPSYGAWENAGGIGSVALFRAYAFVSLYGLVAALDAWRRCQPGTPMRRSARLYALAFGCQDIAYALYGGFTSVTIPERATVLVFWVTTTLIFLFASVFTYAVLKAQLFDIDLRLKATMRRSVVASIFLAVFLVITQLAQNVLSNQLGVLVGGMATGLLLFALTPLQRVSERLANAAMPKVSDTEAYQSFRKLEVYKEAVQSFAAGGRLSARERAALDRIQKKLRLSAGLVRRIHDEAGVPSD